MHSRDDEIQHDHDHEEGEDHISSSIPALNPLWRTSQIDRHYSWLWELYSTRGEGDRLHQRGWLGLWRRESDEYEIRTSLGPLWSQRTYRSEGTLIHENSLFFGLLRWRSSDPEGLECLAPALPGPGWPLRYSRELLELPENDSAMNTPEES